MSEGPENKGRPAKRCTNLNCGHHNPPDAKYCAQCGQSLQYAEAVTVEEPRYLEEVAGAGRPHKPCPEPACGHENLAAARFCARCGRALEEERKNPLREIVQPFIDLIHAPRALWGVNLGYVIEGMVYFGMLGYLAMYFNEYVQLGDIEAGLMVGVLTWGITLAMFFLGGRADKWGVRRAILLAFVLMLGGRVLLTGGATFLTDSAGLWSPVHLVALAGILLIVTGYGMYQPAAYAAVRQFTSEKTAPMGYAMLYALMNLGGWMPTFAFYIRNDEYLGLGIHGTYWVYTGFTVVSLLVTFIILTRKTVDQAIANAKAERAREQEAKGKSTDASVLEAEAKRVAEEDRQRHVPVHLWISMLLVVAAVYLLPVPWRYWVWGVLAVTIVAIAALPVRTRALCWLANHPLANGKFYFFIFCLIPVQTLFAHNWLTLPMYVERAYRESWAWISENFEPAVNFNPLLIFIFVPIVTALTQKRKVYNMMILGTFIMAAPTFLLAMGAKPWTLVSYLIIMTIGEAMWQPRFLQYAAEIAPEGRTGAYMGVAQFPWFLTKVIVPLYSGWFLQKYCPVEGTANTEPMWLIYACIAMTSSVLLVLARPWVGKDFKTKAD